MTHRALCAGAFCLLLLVFTHPCRCAHACTLAADILSVIATTRMRERKLWVKKTHTCLHFASLLQADLTAAVEQLQSAEERNAALQSELRSRQERDGDAQVCSAVRLCPEQRTNCK